MFEKPSVTSHQLCYTLHAGWVGRWIYRDCCMFENLSVTFLELHYTVHTKGGWVGVGVDI